MSTNNFPIYPIEIIIYNKPDYLPLVCQILNTICEHHGFDTAKTQQIIMATEEAVSNVITHAFENEEATFSVIIHPISTGIKISIKDKGLPYNPEKTSFDENQMTGFGNFIIGKLMDNVVYKNLGHQGKELTLFKYFSTRHTELDKKIETKESDTISIEKKEKRPTYTYINRYLTPKDTLEVARCAYESYGYSYPYEHIYFPERVETLNKSGELISMVAEADTGEIAAHLAFMKFEGFNGLYELGIAMTKQKFRGGNIFSNLMEFAQQAVHDKNIQTYYGQCVTTHIYSQSAPIRQGMMPTAMLLSYAPEDVNFKKIVEEMGNRLTVMIVTKVSANRKKSKLYIPEKYCELLKHIYHSLGETHNYIHSAEGNSTDVAQTSLSIAPKLGMGKLIIYAHGKDFKIQIKKHLQQIRKEKVQMLETLFLINQPEAIPIMEELESLGFIFTGILPGATEGDLAIMQYFNGIEPNMENLQLVEEASFLETFLQQQLVNL